MESGVRTRIEQKWSFTEYQHTLHIEHAMPEDSGEVKAIATNRVGEATTTAKLHVEGHFIF